jgi:hypothetical protein
LNLAKETLINPPGRILSKDTALSRIADVENSYLLSDHYILIRGTLCLVHFYARDRTNDSSHSSRQ